MKPESCGNLSLRNAACIAPVPFIRSVGKALAWAVALAGGAGTVSGMARERVLLDDSWSFHRGEVVDGNTVGLDVAGWQSLDLPHDWSIDGPIREDAPGAGAVGFFPSGTGWYCRDLEIPSSWKGRRVVLEFEGIYMGAEVWINGESLGTHPYGYTPWLLDLTSHVKWGARNVVAVRVDNSQQPNSRWYSGSGIYRHVWLHAVDPVHVPFGGVFASTESLDEAKAVVQIQTHVRNLSDRAEKLVVEARLLDPDGREAAVQKSEIDAPAGGEATAVAKLTVAHPRAWSPDSPQRYRCVTRVLGGNRVHDEVATLFGVRTIHWSAERGFEINGRSIDFNGGNVHHDHGVLGAISLDAAEAWRVGQLKAAGFNAIRTSHNPPSTAFLEACDRLGMLVMDEAFDGWASKKNPHDYGLWFHEWASRDVEAMVLRDRNHPSVVMWSIGNEVYERGNAKGVAIAQMLAKRIHELDPTRPVTAGLNGMGKNGEWSALDPIFAQLDIAGYNYETARHADDHARLPERVMLITESYLADVFEGWATSHDQPYMLGDFVWSAWDYLGEAGIGRVFPPGQEVVRHWEGNQFPWHGAYCGEIDITGWRKPVSHYRNIVWDRGEKLYAAVIAPAPGGGAWNPSPWAMPPALPSWTWAGHEGEPLKVEVYSRHPAVRVTLNGTVIGEQATTRAKQFKAVFEVPYAAGRLEVAGLEDGKVAETFVLETADPVARLRLTANRTTLTADGQDVAFVTVEAIDADGRWNPSVACAVKLSVEGAGVLAGAGTGDMTSFDPYTGDTHTLFEGRALAVVRTTRAAGPIKLIATASGMAPVVIELTSALVKTAGAR